MAWDELSPGTGGGTSDPWIPPDQLIGAALPPPSAPSYDPNGPSLDPGYSQPPSDGFVPPQQLIQTALPNPVAPPPEPPAFPSFQPSGRAGAAEWNATLADFLVTQYKPTQAAPIEGTPEATATAMEATGGPVQRVPIDWHAYVQSIQQALAPPPYNPSGPSFDPGYSTTYEERARAAALSDAATTFGITQGIRDANPGLTDEQILAKMGWKPGDPISDLSGTGGPAADVLGVPLRGLGIANQIATDAWESTLGLTGIAAQKLREQLDPNIKYQASQVFDNEIAAIARARGVAPNDPSLAGERVSVARDIFNAATEVKPGETLQEAQARSRVGVAGGMVGPVGFKGIAELANPLYAIGPAEIGAVGRAGLRAGRAVAATEFATSQVGKGLGDLAVKGVIERLGADARTLIEKYRGTLGDNAAIIAHTPDVKKLVREAVVAAGETPEASNLTQVVKAVLDESAPKVETPNVSRVTPPAEAAPAGAPQTFQPTQTAYTPRGTAVQTSYDVAEAGSLVTSHDTALRPNPVFPPELQPRNRTRAASEQQINDIAAGLQPNRLGDSTTVGEGAPIVGPGNVVESGNARTIALKRLYEQQHATGETYREWLTTNADRFGIDPQTVEGMSNPVLIRRRVGDMTPQQRADFVGQANEPAVAAYSASEQAVSDSARITPDQLSTFNVGEGDITAASNRDFVKSFIEGVPPTERGALVDASGALSQQGVTRVRNAIFQKAYGDVSALEKIAESTDSNVRNIANGMIAAAPKIAQMRAGIESGALHSGLDISPDIAAAMRKLSQLRDEGTPVSVFLQQQTLLGRELSPTAEDILAFMSENSRSSKKITDFLNRYADEVTAAGNPAQAGLFGDVAAPQTEQLLERAANPTQSADQLFPAAATESGITLNAETLSQRIGTPETAAQKAQNEILKAEIARREAQAAPQIRPSGARTVPVNPNATPVANEGPRIGDRVVVNGKSGVIDGVRMGGKKIDVRFAGEDVAQSVRMRDVQDITRPTTPINPALEAKLAAPRSPDLTPAQIAEAKAPIPEMGAAPPAEPPKPPAPAAAPPPEDLPLFSQPNDPATSVGPLDVQKAIGDLSTPLGQQRGPRSHKVTAEAAANLLNSGQVSIDTLIGLPPGAIVDAEHLKAYDGLVKDAIGTVDSLITGNASPDAVFQSLMDAANARRRIRGLGEEPGRATEIQKTLETINPTKALARTQEGQIASMLGMLDDQAAAAELGSSVRDALRGATAEERAAGLRNITLALSEALDEQAARQELVAAARARVPRTPTVGPARQAIREIVRANLLSGLADVTNVMGNQLQMISNVVALTGAAGVESARAGIGAAIGKDVTRAVHWSSLPPAYAAMVQAIPRGAKAGWDVAVHGKSVSSRFADFEKEVLPGILGNLTEKAGLGEKLGQRAGGAALWGSRAAMGTDQLSKEMYRALYTDLVAHETAAAKGLKGDAYDALTAKLKAAPSARTQVRALEFADRETWNSAANRVGQWMGEVRRAKDIPVVSETMFGLMPFINTHTNILDQGLRWTPAGFGRVAKEWRSLDPITRAMYTSKAAIGSASMVVLGATIMGTDNITGSGPLDANRNIDWRTTHQPYSVRIGGQWVDYSVLGSAAIPMMMMADYADAAKYDGHMPDQRELGPTIAHLVKSVWNDAGYFDNLTQFLDAFQSGGTAALAKTLANFAREATPQSAALTTARNVLEGASPPVSSKLPFEQQAWQRYRNFFPGNADARGFQRPRQGLGVLSPIRFQPATDVPQLDRRPFFGFDSGATTSPTATPTQAPSGGRYIPPSQRAP